MSRTCGRYGYSGSGCRHRVVGPADMTVIGSHRRAAATHPEPRRAVQTCNSAGCRHRLASGPAAGSLRRAAVPRLDRTAKNHAGAPPRPALRPGTHTGRHDAGPTGGDREQLTWSKVDMITARTVRLAQRPPLLQE